MTFLPLPRNSLSLPQSEVTVGFFFMFVINLLSHDFFHFALRRCIVLGADIRCDTGAMETTINLPSIN